MPAITVKNLPQTLLERLRALAEADDRSLNRQVIHLLEEAVLRREAEGGSLEELARRQAAAWRSLAGRWKSDETPAEEGRTIMDARTPGR